MPAVPLLFHALRRLYQHIAKVSWPALAVMTAVHFASSWLLLAAFETAEITGGRIFWYFYIVTATTVGYGDYAPVTTGGRIVAVAWLIPGSITLLTAVIGKVVTTLSSLWRRRMRGAGDLSHLSGHIVILGWHGDRTRQMVDHILADRLRDSRVIVICGIESMENPVPDQAEWVRGPALTDPDLLRRAGIATAARAVVFDHSDAQTLTGALAVAAQNPQLHLVAHFDSPDTARLLATHCPQAEVNLSLSVDMMVRSVEDPGSSRLQRKLLSVTQGQTQFSMRFPENRPGTDYGTLFDLLKQRCDATLIAVAADNVGDNLRLNAPRDTAVQAGSILYYIASQRLRANDIAWPD